jgi:hypothetical protein
MNKLPDFCVSHFIVLPVLSARKGGTLSRLTYTAFCSKSALNRRLTSNMRDCSLTLGKQCGGDMSHRIYCNVLEAASTRVVCILFAI